MNISIRKASEDDKDFLITSIIEAEKSGSDMISYCTIFSISEKELRILLEQILDEEIEGQELCISNFLIAEVDGEKAAASSTWIEMESGMSSSMIKSNLFLFLAGMDVIRNAGPSLHLMSDINIARGENALQVECVFTAEKYRGLGLGKQLIDEHIRLKQQAEILFDKVQVILLGNNSSAQKAYEKAGFSVVQQKTCTDNAILNLLPCNTKILMEKKNKN
jgi:ribosomal protein S18 acetylase RimI-like enzyme